jgi:hypothetical protein
MASTLKSQFNSADTGKQPSNGYSIFAFLPI